MKRSLRSFDVCEDMWDDPRVALLPDRKRLACLGLWVRAGSRSSCRGDNGKVPRAKIRELGGSVALAEALVEAGFWARSEHGYVFCDDLHRFSRPREAIDREAVFERSGWQCKYCAAPLTLDTGHVDHIIPTSRGGSDKPFNLVAACPPCNLSKGAKTPEEWRQ